MNPRSRAIPLKGPEGLEAGARSKQPVAKSDCSNHAVSSRLPTFSMGFVLQQGGLSVCKLSASSR